MKIYSVNPVNNFKLNSNMGCNSPRKAVVFGNLPVSADRHANGAYKVFDLEYLKLIKNKKVDGKDYLVEHPLFYVYPQRHIVLLDGAKVDTVYMYENEGHGTLQVSTKYFYDNKNISNSIPTSVGEAIFKAEREAVREMKTFYRGNPYEGTDSYDTLMIDSKSHKSLSGASYRKDGTLDAITKYKDGKAVEILEYDETGKIVINTIQL